MSADVEIANKSKSAHFESESMIRLLAVAAFISGSLVLVSECPSQTRGFFNRHASPTIHRSAWQPSPATTSQRIAASTPHAQPYVFPTRSYFEPRNPVISRILDGKMTYKYRDPAEVDSRYIGGLHRNTFNNIGLPSGDIGIRGNALNWNTW